MNRVLTVILGVLLTLSTITQLAAQEATPVMPSGGPLDLAAMALPPEDVPEGFFDDYFEVLVPADLISDMVLWGAPAPDGLDRSYQSFYFNPEEGAGIHVFLLEFASAEQATAGATAINELLRPPLPEGTTIGPDKAAGPAIGDEASTLTSVTYDTWAAGGPLVEIVASSFRRGNLIAGVSVEKWFDPPPDGTPAASPVAADPGQEQLATSLASALDGRITDVLADNSPTGADLTLPDMVLPIDQIVDGPIAVLGGYKSGIDLLRCGICGEENSLVPFAERALGGYSRTVPVGLPLADAPGEPQPPFISVAVSAFDSPETALAVLEAVRQTPNDRNTPGPIPRGVRTLAADPTIPGADGAIAFTAAPEEPNAPSDSAGVDFVVGSWWVTVDVQGGLSGDEAMGVAVDLATQQAACLTSGEPCDSITTPDSLTG